MNANQLFCLETKKANVGDEKKLSDIYQNMLSSKFSSIFMHDLI